MPDFNHLYEGPLDSGGTTGGGIPPSITQATVIYADTGSPVPQPHYLFLTSPVGWLMSDTGSLIVQG
jgi:hypothetical protein